MNTQTKKSALNKFSAIFLGVTLATNSLTVPTSAAIRQLNIRSAAKTSRGTSVSVNMGANKLPDQVENTKNGLLKVSYEDSRNANASQILNYLKNEKIYESLTATINKRVKLPQDIKVVAKDCGFSNAFYRERDKSITMCNELAFSSFNLFKSGGYSENQALLLTKNLMYDCFLS